MVSNMSASTGQLLFIAFSMLKSMPVTSQSTREDTACSEVSEI